MVIHWRFIYGSINIAGIQVRKQVFYVLNNAVKICFYALKISKNIEINYAFHFKAYFLSTFHKSCLLDVIKVRLGLSWNSSLFLNSYIVILLVWHSRRKYCEIKYFFLRPQRPSDDVKMFKISPNWFFHYEFLMFTEAATGGVL